METTKLGKTGLTVSRIAFGTWQLGGDWGQTDEAAATTAMHRALEIGVNLFDTAQAYGFGASEQLLARALRGVPRDELVIATKGGLRMDGPVLRRDSSPQWLRRGVEDSLRALETDYIDLYQVHWPDPATPFAETATALGELVREGKIRHVGVSNYDAAQIDEFSRALPVETIQPPYHLFRRDIESELLPYAEAHDIGVLVYGPLAHGLLSGALTEQTTFDPGDWRSRSAAFSGEGFRSNLDVVARLSALAAELGISVDQLAVAWVLQHRAVHVAIIGTRRAEHVDQAARAAEVVLTTEAMHRIDEILTSATPISGPSPETV